MEVLKLLRSKNRCLERFLTLSEEFLTLAVKGDFSELQAFQGRRESTLKAMDLFDRKISEVVTALPYAQRTPSLIEAVKKALNEKEILVHQILEVDLKIISKIEDEKNNLLKELSSSRKSRAVLGKFKSTWVSGAGEELDETL